MWFRAGVIKKPPPLTVMGIIIGILVLTPLKAAGLSIMGLHHLGNNMETPCQSARNVTSDWRLGFQVQGEGLA